MKRLRFLMFFITIIISIQAFAINSFASDTTTFDHKEATALIGFIFDINPDDIREIDWDENSIYKLLTGQYQKGSQEEAIAKISFLSIAYENINQYIGEQNNTMTASRAHLLKYLEKQASDDISGDIANGIIKNILKSVSKCVMYDICGWDSSVIETFELSYDAIKDLKSLPAKANAYAEKVQAAVVAGMEVASSNKRNMYMYFREYVNANVSMGEYADLYMEAYDLQLSQTIIAYDPILNWHSENNIQTLKRWAKYVSDMEISLSGQSGSDTNFVAKFVLNYPFAQDIICYTVQESIDFIQNDMYKQTREGYTFDNWYYDTACTIEYDGNFYEGIVLYAKWNKKPPTRFLITFNSNCAEVNNFSYIYDITVGNWIDYKMSRPGYVFEGWYWDAACTQKASGGNITINRDLTFYAKWVSQFKYTISNGTATITGINGYQIYDGETITDIEIPAYIDGYPVVAVGNSAFGGTKISSVIIPDDVTIIGAYAFSHCNSLNSITIGRKVSNIGTEAFSGCPSLKKIEVSQNNNYYLSMNGILFNKDKTTLIQYPRGMESTEYLIPDSVTNIGDRAFECCNNLTTITIPDSVTTIEDYAFGSCISLTTVMMGEGVTSIGSNAFSYCYNLANITIPRNIRNIDYRAFYSCDSLTSIVIIGNGEAIIGMGAFGECMSLKYVTIGTGVKVIGENAFSCCDNLLNVEIAEGVTSIEEDAFYACDGLTSVSIPNSVTSIGYSAFGSCDSLISVTIPDSVTSMAYNVFSMCRDLVKIEVAHNNNNYSSVNGVLFNKDKTTLIQYPAGKADTEYIMPGSVTSIECGAFALCDSISNIVLSEKLEIISYDTFYRCENLKSIIIPDSVTEISGMAFYYCSSLKSVIIGNGVNYIADGAFYGCDNLKTTYYRGTKEKWNNLTIWLDNDPITKNVVFVDFTKTTVSEDGKTFIVNPINIEEGNTVIIALYKEDLLVDVQKALYKSEELEFETTKDYDSVKIMVWEDLNALTPVTEPETI